MDQLLSFMLEAGYAALPPECEAVALKARFVWASAEPARTAMNPQMIVMHARIDNLIAFMVVSRFSRFIDKNQLAHLFSKCIFAV